MKSNVLKILGWLILLAAITHILNFTGAIISNIERKPNIIFILIAHRGGEILQIILAIIGANLAIKGNSSWWIPIFIGALIVPFASFPTNLTSLKYDFDLLISMSFLQSWPAFKIVHQTLFLPFFYISVGIVAFMWPIKIRLTNHSKATREKARAPLS
jgi:hypothetical protein